MQTSFGLSLPTILVPLILANRPSEAGGSRLTTPEESPHQTPFLGSIPVRSQGSALLRLEQSQAPGLSWEALDCDLRQHLLVCQPRQCPGLSHSGSLSSRPSGSYSHHFQRMAFVVSRSYAGTMLCCPEDVHCPIPHILFTTEPPQSTLSNTSRKWVGLWEESLVGHPGCL